MLVRHERLWSPALGRNIWVNAYGHFGRPVLVFPTAGCGANDWERHGVIDTLAPWLEAGKLKLYCTQSIDNETLLDDEAPGAWRVHLLKCYEDYVVNNLVPAIYADCRGAVPIAVTGASTGGYHVAHHALKRPDLFPWALGLSGKYDLARLLGGHPNGDAYFLDPLAYLYNMGGDHLNWVRAHAHLVLVVGQGPHEGNCLPETHRLADLLAQKGISHERDIWGHDVAHHWFWWKRQIVHHFSRAL